MKRIEEKKMKLKALVTGASSGIGKELAKHLANQGYDLILVARDEKNLKLVKSEIEKIGRKAEIVTMDLTEEENIRKLYEKFPNVDLLINNAGFGDCGEFTQTSLEKELAMIKTNITAYHMLTKLYLPNMVKKDQGKMLNVASIAGFMPGPLMATYYATKAYVVRLSEGIREELKKQKSHVQISILCPGPVNTNFNQVANVKFHLREADSSKIASYTIKQLEKGKFYIIPGIDTKIIKWGSHIFPTSWIAKIAYCVQRKKLEP